MAAKQLRAQYTQEFKLEVVRQVHAGQAQSAVAMAWWCRRPAAGLIFLSDRGAQYCSGEFQDTLKVRGICSSMSRKGNCRDNAPTQCFWSGLLVASVHEHKFATRE